MIKSIRFLNKTLLYMLILFMTYTPVSAEEIEITEYAESYDGRNAGVITPVRDQGDSSLCWAYAAISAAEASILKSDAAAGETIHTLSLSPLQLGYARHNRGADPLGNTSGESTGENWYYTTGNSSYAPTLFSQWCGPVDSSLAQDCNGWENAEFIMKDAVSFDRDHLKNSEEARRVIKKAIIEHGAVTFSYNNVREKYYYNPSSETGGASYPHACTIIGWDDTIAADSFSPGGATQDGGWLVKNSYSSLPYFYLSYDNTSANIFAFSFVKRDKYDYNYFYDSDILDFAAGAILKHRRAANIFEAKKGEQSKDEYITGVNIGIEGKNTTLTVKVYQNLHDSSDPTSGILAATEEIYLKHAGYYTVELSTPVLVEKGSMFSVVVEISDGENSYIKITEDQGNSFLRRTNLWESAQCAPRIKAYTKLREEKMYFTDTEFCLNTSENESGVFVLAYYKGSRLGGVRLVSVSASERYCIDIPAEWEKAEGNIIKGFLWKSVSGMTPVLNVEKIWE